MIAYAPVLFSTTETRTLYQAGRTALAHGIEGVLVHHETCDSLPFIHPTGSCSCGLTDTLHDLNVAIGLLTRAYPPQT